MKCLLFLGVIGLTTSALAASPKQMCLKSVRDRYGNLAAKNAVVSPIKGSKDLYTTVELNGVLGDKCWDLVRCRAENRFKAEPVDSMCENQD